MFFQCFLPVFSLLLYFFQCFVYYFAFSNVSSSASTSQWCFENIRRLVCRDLHQTKVLVLLLPLRSFSKRFYFFMPTVTSYVGKRLFVRRRAEISESCPGLLSLLILLILQGSSVSCWRTDASLIL